MADDETADGEEGIVNVSASLISNSQSAELVKPAQRSLDDPAMYTKATAVSRVPLGSPGGNADLSQSVAMGLGIVGAIGIQRIKPIAWRTDFPSNGRDRVDQFKQLRYVMFIGGGGCAMMGMPPPSVRIWCLLPGFRRSTGFGPVSSPSRPHAPKRCPPRCG